MSPVERNALNRARHDHSLDPAQVDPSHVFDADMTRYLDWLQQGKAIPGEAIMTPGEPERREPRKTRQERRAATGRDLGVDRRGGAERWREPGPLVLISLASSVNVPILDWPHALHC